MRILRLAIFQVWSLKIGCNQKFAILEAQPRPSRSPPPPSPMPLPPSKSSTATIHLDLTMTRTRRTRVAARTNNRTRFRLIYHQLLLPGYFDGLVRSSLRAFECIKHASTTGRFPQRKGQNLGAASSGELRGRRFRVSTRPVRTYGGPCRTRTSRWTGSRSSSSSPCSSSPTCSSSS